MNTETSRNSIESKMKEEILLQEKMHAKVHLDLPRNPTESEIMKQIHLQEQRQADAHHPFGMDLRSNHHGFLTSVHDRRIVLPKFKAGDIVYVTSLAPYPQSILVVDTFDAETVCVRHYCGPVVVSFGEYPSGELSRVEFGDKLFDPETKTVHTYRRSDGKQPWLKYRMLYPKSFEKHKVEEGATITIDSHSVAKVVFWDTKTDNGPDTTTDVPTILKSLRLRDVIKDIQS